MENYRETIQGSSRLLSELPLVGYARLRRARVPGLPPHRHPGAYEIFFIESGEVEWWVENEVVKLKANHIYINKPGETHGSLGPSLKPCSYYWFQLVFSKSKGLPGLAPREASAWKKSLANIQPRAFRAAPSLKRYFTDLFEECRAPRDHATVIARSTLHLLLGTILRMGQKQAQADLPQPYCSYAIRRALYWLDRSPTEPVRVSQLARAAGLSVSRFRERFLQEIGLSPSGYLCRHRIQQAKRHLQSQKIPITTAGHMVGFSSSQYFATVFKRMEGMTPSEFRSRMHAG